MEAAGLGVRADLAGKPLRAIAAELQWSEAAVSLQTIGKGTDRGMVDCREMRKIAPIMGCPVTSKNLAEARGFRYNSAVARPAP